MKKLIATAAAFIIALSLCACGNTPSTTTQSDSSESSITEVSEHSEEDFKKKYDELLIKIEILSVYADYAGNVNAIVWDNVGVDKVAKYLNYVKTYYNDDQYAALVCEAFGLSYLNASAKEQALNYAEQYVGALDNIETASEEINADYKVLNSTYGSEFSLDDLKEYYAEVSSYADFASTIDGSYKSYTQALSDYQTNIAKLKKMAEIAF